MAVCVHCTIIVCCVVLAEDDGPFQVKSSETICVVVQSLLQSKLEHFFALFFLFALSPSETKRE
jgi:hypothetical protein